MYKLDSSEGKLSLIKMMLTKPWEKVLNGTNRSLPTMVVVQEAFKKAM